MLIISEEEVYVLVQQLWPEGRLPVRHSPGVMCSRGMEAVDAVFELSLCLAAAPSIS